MERAPGLALAWGNPGTRAAFSQGRVQHQASQASRLDAINRTTHFRLNGGRTIGAAVDPPFDSRASVVLPGCARPPRGGPGFFVFHAVNTVTSGLTAFHIFHEFLWL